MHSLSADQLCVFKGERCLFSGLAFSLESGGLLALRGANGSGKTSLLRALAGLSEFDEGSVLMNGQAIHPTDQRFRIAVTWYGHQAGFKADLTAAENLAFERHLRPQSDEDISRALDLLGLERQRELPVRSLSAGQQRRAALARLLLSETPIWLMDEPFTNLDRNGKGLINSLLDQHLQAGGLAIVATHEPLAIASGLQELEIT